MDRLTMAAGLALGLAFALGTQALSAQSPPTPTLGGRVAATQALEAHGQYSVARVKSAIAGEAVREYVAPNGVVFGLAWQGPVMPDLSQYLGARFQTFQKAAQTMRHRGPLHVEVGDLVVENSGHMRAFRGRAYLTDAMPAGLAPGVIQ